MHILTISLFIQKMGADLIIRIIKVFTTDGEDEDALIVRIHTQKSSLLRENLSSYVTVMRLAAAGGVSAPVLAEFNNGLVYTFTQGVMVLHELQPQNAHIQMLVPLIRPSIVILMGVHYFHIKSK